MNRRLRTFFAVLICLHMVALAQDAPDLLNIVTLDGEGAINNVGQRAVHFPSVRIEDQNQKPVSGVAVVFTLPTEGPSGEFANGSKTVTVITDNNGVATAPGLKVNWNTGKLQIHITASYRGKTARSNITQFNMAVPGKAAVKRSNKTLWIIVAIAAGAAAGGSVAALSHSGNSSASSTAGSTAPPAIVITPGTGTVGPPH